MFCNSDSSITMSTALKFFCTYWRSVIIVLTPILASFLFVSSVSQELKCAYVIIVMAVYWMTEAIPLAVTALIPVFAFPLLGVMPSKDVCLVYMKETNMMFVGGLMVAIAVEHCNLHQRIALFVILKVGQSPRRLMAGFMITTMFLSMWISNTATTAMMVPIVNAILQELQKTSPADDHDLVMASNCHTNVGYNNTELTVDISRNTKEAPEISSNQLSENSQNENKQPLKNMYFLATAYAANIGGTGSLTGTGPNLVVKEVLDSSFTKPTGLNFASWMMFNVPGMLICTFIGWVWLQVLFMGVGKWSKTPKSTPEREKNIRNLIQAKYNELGVITFHEKVVLTGFITLVFLWLFREPGFIYGWADAFKGMFGQDFHIGDAPPALLIAFLLFVIPSKPNFKTIDGQYSNSEGCLTWAIVHQKVPWGIILLLGGGFAMAEATKVSGLSYMMGEKLRGIESWPLTLSVFGMSVMTAMATEVASNTATASILMNVLKDLSLSLCVNPLYFMIPTAICCSYAFMLPVATPPNAIVYGAANMKTWDMMKAGFVMNILCIIVVNLMISSLGIPIFDINSVPTWINSTSDGLIPKCNISQELNL